MFSHEQQDILEFGYLVIDRRKRIALLRGSPLDLTSGEFELLSLLASRAGEILSREELCKGIRGFGYDGLDRTIDIRVTRLRKKLGDTGRRNRLLKTIRGVGYMIVNEL